MNTIDGENTEIAILKNMWDWWFLLNFSYKTATNNLANARSHRVNPHTLLISDRPHFVPHWNWQRLLSMSLWSFATKNVWIGDFLWKKRWLVHVKPTEITFSSKYWTICYVTCRDLIVSENCYMAISQTKNPKQQCIFPILLQSFVKICWTLIIVLMPKIRIRTHKIQMPCSPCSFLKKQENFK